MSGRGQEHEVELAELLEEVRSLRKAIDVVRRKRNL